MSGSSCVAQPWVNRCHDIQCTPYPTHLHIQCLTGSYAVLPPQNSHVLVSIFTEGVACGHHTLTCTCRFKNSSWFALPRCRRPAALCAFGASAYPSFQCYVDHQAAHDILFVCVHVRRDALFAKGLLRVQQYLAGGRDNTTCPICLGGIKPTEAIWACGKSCYALFHMTCIQVGVTTLSISSAEGEVLWVGWTVEAKVAAVTAAVTAAAHVPFKCHAHMWAC